MIFLNKHISSKNKIRIRKKLKHRKNRIISLEHKTELIEKIIDYIINDNNIISDDFFLELQYTVKKIE